MYGYFYLYNGVVQQVVAYKNIENAEKRAVKEANKHSFCDEDDKEIVFENYSDVENFMRNNGTSHDIFVKEIINGEESYELIKVYGYFLDSKERIEGYKAAIGQYDGSFDDSDIFYWFDDFNKVIGPHEDFIITKYSVNITPESVKQFGLFFDELLNGVNEKLEQLNDYIEKRNNGIFSKEAFLEFISEKTDWNICDKCGRIEKSTTLRWLEYLDSPEDEKLAEEILSNTNALAICKKCWEEFKAQSQITAHVIHSIYDDTEEWCVQLDQDGETKEMSCFASKEEADKRANYINALKTERWEDIK